MDCHWQISNSHIGINKAFSNQKDSEEKGGEWEKYIDIKIQLSR